jgi:hypothetical protein
VAPVARPGHPVGMWTLKIPGRGSNYKIKNIYNILSQFVKPPCDSLHRYSLEGLRIVVIPQPREVRASRSPLQSGTDSVR